MDSLILLFNILIIGTFLLFFVKSLTKKILSESVVIASLYPMVATMVGQELGKTFISLLLYGIVFFFLLQERKKYFVKKQIQKSLYLVAISLLFLYLIAGTLTSAAMGYDYLSEKIVFTLSHLILPAFLISFVSPNSKYDLLFIINFFKVLSLILAISMLINAYEVGINDLLSSQFMTRVAIGDANVIWIGRLISIGFVLTLLKSKNNLYKIVNLIILMVAMILTGSKAVLLFPLVSLIIFTFFLYQSNSKKLYSKLKLGLFISFVSFGFLFIISHFNPDAIERRFSLKSNTIDSRKGSIDKTLEHLYFTENFFFGNGYATSGYPMVGNYNERNYPHNIVVELLYELGIIGLLFCFLPLLIPLWFYKYRKICNRNFSLLMTVYIMFLLYAQTSGDLIANTTPFILAGYLINIMPPKFNIMWMTNNQMRMTHIKS